MSTIDAIASRAEARPRSDISLLAVIRAQLVQWARARRTRLDLLELSEHELKDLGLTREAARQEAMRPFWDIGGHKRGRP